MKMSLMGWTVTSFVAVGLVATVLSSCQESSARRTQERNALALAQTIKVREAEHIERCKGDWLALQQQHAALIEAGKPWDAARSLDRCALALTEEGAGKLIQQGEVLAWTQQAKDPSQLLYDRVNAIAKIEKHYPDAAPPLLALRRQLEAARKAESAKLERARKAKARSEGVHIGMSQDDVLASSWGRPERVNRTTFSFGIKEQWVYPGGGYLYFTDGVLDAISN